MRAPALALAGALACTAAPPVPAGAGEATGEATIAASSSTAAGSTSDPTSTGEPAEPSYTCEDAPGDPLELSIGFDHVCARRGCAAQCWGSDAARQLGHARAGWASCYHCDEEPGCCLGDDEAPAAWGDLQLGAPVRQIAAGYVHTCALLEGGDVLCWGDNQRAQLGLGHRVGTPAGQRPWQRPRVKLGGAAVQISVGTSHSCAVLAGGAVRCWGSGDYGRLGYGAHADIGDDELPEAAGDVDVGGPVARIAAGGSHTCALLVDGRVRCWGLNLSGELGRGDLEDIGDDETPASAGDVAVGAAVVQIDAGVERTCVVTDAGGVRCWGGFPHGYPSAPGVACITCADDPTCCVGDDETPAEVGDLELGGAATQVSVGNYHACALLGTGAPVCWGVNAFGGLGLGLTNGASCYDCAGDEPCCVGDDEVPAALGPVQLGAPAAAIEVGQWTSCAVLVDGRVRCWGRRYRGLLGDGETPSACSSECDEAWCCVGDDETPIAQAEVVAFSP